MAVQTGVLADALSTSEAQAIAWEKMLADLLRIYPSDPPVATWARVISDEILARHTSAQRGVYRKALGDTAELAVLLQLARRCLLSQPLTVHQSQALAWGLTMLGRLVAADTLTSAAKYHEALAQAFVLSTSFSRVVGAMLAQVLAVSGVPLPAMCWAGDLSQDLALTEALANTLVLVLSQDIDLDDAQLVKAIYRGDALLDGINLGGIYVSPSGMVTTWAVNTRTNAVTEYSNFGFNGFTQLGTHYVATSPAGVYELEGDTDAGTPIIADILSGLLQLNGTKLSGLKGAYLAMRGSGEVCLKIITGDGKERVYAATTVPGMATTKINIGKGIRARYLSFELTTTGQDFDLESLEFVPMFSDRRV